MSNAVRSDASDAVRDGYHPREELGAQMTHVRRAACEAMSHRDDFAARQTRG
jgi:hypothetical protein